MNSIVFALSNLINLDSQQELQCIDQQEAENEGTGITESLSEAILKRKSRK